MHCTNTCKHTAQIHVVTRLNTYLKIQVGREKARPALQLIEYSLELHAAMEYVFGGAIVCDNLNDAKKV